MAIWLYVFLGLAVWGLESLHHWLASSLSGSLMGCALMLWWARGNAYQYIEYWSRTCPRWMLIILGPPPLEGSLDFGILKRYYYSSLPTSLPLVGGIGMTITLMFLAIFGDNLYIGFAVMFTITWVAGIILFKQYFKRHKLTQIKDWSKFPPE